MKIQFLGTGNAFSDFRVNYNNNALVEHDGTLLLLDCGVTACQSLKDMARLPAVRQDLGSLSERTDVGVGVVGSLRTMDVGLEST